MEWEPNGRALTILQTIEYYRRCGGGGDASKPLWLYACGLAPSRGSGWVDGGKGKATSAETNARDGGRRARLVFALNSDWHGLVPASLSRVRIGQEAGKSARDEPREHRPRGERAERLAVKKRDGRRARLVFALNSDRYELVRAAHSRVHFGQEAKSAQNGPCEKSRPDFSLPARRLDFRPLYGPLRPCGAGFPSGQARRVRRRARSRIKCSKLKCRISQLWSCRQEA